MKLAIKKAMLALLGTALLLTATGCGEEATPYETNNADNYTVSVKYDANGGIFTTNTSVIVDSYNITDSEKNGEGMVEIALLSPDNTARGNDAFQAVNNGHFLAGWYAVRNETKNNEGETVYTYSDKWDFEKDLLEVDASKTYSSESPVITLYAAWVPLFEIQFYSLGSDELLKSYVFDPTAVSEISVPAWDEETGVIEMHQFPEKSGYTYNKAYYDAEGKTALEGETIAHTGVIDYETGTAKDHVMKVYVEWTEGEWYRIYNAEQFLENASLNGNYEIFADLDFEGEIWPTSLMYGNYGGTIKGNGHTLSNISFAQTNNSKVNAGLFGYLTETANISDLTFDNVTFTIEAGTRVAGTSYGILAGTVSKDAVLSNVKLLNGTLQIDSECYFGVDDYSIGLVCGMGNAEVIESSELQCIATGENPESLKITVNGNTVTVEAVAE